MEEKSNKLISVILPVKDGERHICAAIESVLHQTYKNFELLIINDGSTDNTLSLIGSFNDERIKIFNTQSEGLVSALNLGLKQSKGEYIARMDADDICIPERFLIQVNILNKNEDIGVVCSDVEFIDENNKKLGDGKSVIKNQKQLIKGLTLKSYSKPIIHPSVMMRRSLLQTINGYRDYIAAEDRDLWLRLSLHTKFFRISKPLLKYRITATGVSRSKNIQQGINSMLSILNYEFFILTSMDLYKDNPEILFHFRKYFNLHIAKSDNNAKSFHLLKQCIKSKKTTDMLKSFSILLNFNLLFYILLNRICSRKQIDAALKQLLTFIPLMNKFNK
jgi:glycosyltransferase involved in cell wall biosynthesis